MRIDSTYYPISLDEIQFRINKKNGIRNNNSYKKKQYELFEKIDHENIKEIINEFNEKIIRVDGEIPTHLNLNDGDRYLFISYDQSKYTHGIHKYPAKFFPELPRWFIRRYSKVNDLILDPFSGSGTTNLEALLNHRHSVGVDVDPFSRFLAQVKITPLDEKKIESSKNYLLKSIVNYIPTKVLESDIPQFPYRDNWFNKEIVLELAYLKKIIENMEFNDNIKNFYRVCFSSIIRMVSNADNNCTRTVVRKKLNKKVYPADALTKFAEAILINVQKAKEFARVCPKNVKVEFPADSDARNINFKDALFDLAITSPPYANAVDYPRTHQLEIYWLGFETGSLTPLKKKHVGTESVSKENYQYLHKIEIEEADRALIKIFEKDKRRAYIAFKYLKDMKKNLAEVYRVLKPNARYIVVLGNNTIRGEVFENWKYIMHLSEKVGFRVENYFGSEIIRHFIKVPREERINTDWILVLRK